MNWFAIIILVIAYLMVGGMVMTVIEKTEVSELWNDFLGFLPPIVIVFLWPVFLVIGIVVFVVFGAAALGGMIMDGIIKWFKGDGKQDGADK